MDNGLAGGRSALRSAKDGREESGEVVGAAPESGRGKPAADDRKNGEHDQRPEHAPRRFMHVDMMFVVALRAEESEKDKPEHVKGGEQRGQQAQSVQRTAAGKLERAEQDGILAEESGQGREARQG